MADAAALDKVYKDIKDKMEKALLSLKDEMGTIRTGRASPALLDRIKVEYYGAPTDLRQLASVTVPDPRTIMIVPRDKSATKDIEKAIQKSDLGLTPNNDGKAIRLSLPELTQERRQDLVKQVKKKGEDKKIILRNFRREANDQVKKDQKDGAITEDQQKHGLDQVQKLLDQYISKIDEIIKHKEEDVLSV
jgi:ribosome recycling factor